MQRWAADAAAMVPLPPVTPTVGLMSHVRLARDYYVRIGSNDYSVDPRAIGRFVDVIATPDLVAVTCNGQIVATHQRFWGTGATITDPEHVAIAKQLRSDFNALRARRAAQHATRSHADGHVVALRALPDYDALFGVDFDQPDPDTHEGASSS